MRKLSRYIKLSAITALAFAFVASPVANAAVTINTVTETQRNGWLFNPDLSTSTDYSFSNTEASIGNGSLYVKPINNVTRFDKFIALLPQSIETDDVATVSFDFRLGVGVPTTKVSQFYLNVYTNLPASNSYYDCRFDQVATSGSDAVFSTVSFQANVAPTTVMPRGGALCPAKLSDMPNGSKVNAISINVGDTSVTLNDQDVAGYLDNVNVITTDDNATYDFEPYVEAAQKEQCKNDGWQVVARNDGSTFKNQGQCVAYVVSSQNSKHHRTELMPSVRF